MLKKIIFILPIVILWFGVWYWKYYCKDLCKERAQELLAQWHWYLDRDNDWSACESSPRCGSSYTRTQTVNVSCSSNQCKLGSTCYSKPNNASCAWYWWNAWLCNDWYYESWNSCIKINEPQIEVKTPTPVVYQSITQNLPKKTIYIPTNKDAVLIADVVGKTNTLSLDSKKRIHNKLLLILPSLEWRTKYVLSEISAYLLWQIYNQWEDLTAILWNLFWDEQTTNSNQIISQNVNRVETAVQIQQEPIIDWWKYVVSSVIDWDTIKLQSNWENFTVRLIW